MRRTRSRSATCPSGPHTLLTATVLAEQQRIAPLRNFKIVTIRRGGSSASADVSYTLAFRVRPVLVTGTVQLHQGNSGWRLDRVAIPSQLESTTARERQSIVGAAIPAGPTLMFPGALPIRLDSPYLQLDPGRDYVAFDTTRRDQRVRRGDRGRPECGHCRAAHEVAPLPVRRPRRHLPVAQRAVCAGLRPRNAGFDRAEGRHRRYRRGRGRDAARARPGHRDRAPTSG